MGRSSRAVSPPGGSRRVGPTCPRPDLNRDDPWVTAPSTLRGCHYATGAKRGLPPQKLRPAATSPASFCPAACRRARGPASEMCGGGPGRTRFRVCPASPSCQRGQTGRISATFYSCSPPLRRPRSSPGVGASPPSPLCSQVSGTTSTSARTCQGVIFQGALEPPDGFEPPTLRLQGDSSVQPELQGLVSLRFGVTIRSGDRSAISITGTAARRVALFRPCSERSTGIEPAVASLEGWCPAIRTSTAELATPTRAPHPGQLPPFRTATGPTPRRALTGVARVLAVGPSADGHGAHRRRPCIWRGEVQHPPRGLPGGSYCRTSSAKS